MPRCHKHTRGDFPINVRRRGSAGHDVVLSGGLLTWPLSFGLLK